MKALRFGTREEAEARSAAAWSEKIGRGPKPGDVTRFLWPVEDTAEGAQVAVPDADAAMLPSKERRLLRDRLDVEALDGAPLPIDEEPRVSTGTDGLLDGVVKPGV